MPYFSQAGQILIEFVFGALIALVLLRVMLQAVRANFHNPICQFVYKTTNPLLMPLRRFIPAWRRLDNAGVVLAWVLTFLKLWLMSETVGQNLGWAGLAVIAVADLLGFSLMIGLGLILVRIVLSFIASESYHPIVPLVYQLTDPVLKPLQRILPALGGLDFSPLVAWLLITLARVLIVQPLLDLGMQLALG